MRDHATKDGLSILSAGPRSRKAAKAATAGRHPNRRTAELWGSLTAGAALALLVMVAAFVFRPGAEQGWLFATRWTARLSVMLFVATYLLRAVPVRRRLGLAFAGSHFVHAVMFIAYLTMFGANRSVVSTVGGTFGYVVLLAMVLVTFVPSHAAPALRHWGMVYLWIVFAFSYLGRAVEAGDRQGEGLFGLALLAAVPITRLARGRSNPKTVWQASVEVIRAGLDSPKVLITSVWGRWRR